MSKFEKVTLCDMCNRILAENDHVDYLTCDCVARKKALMCENCVYNAEAFYCKLCLVYQHSYCNREADMCNVCAEEK